MPQCLHVQDKELVKEYRQKEEWEALPIIAIEQ